MIVLLVILQVNLQDRFGEVMIQNLRVRRTPLNACLADGTFVNCKQSVGHMVMYSLYYNFV